MSEDTERLEERPETVNESIRAAIAELKGDEPDVEPVEAALEGDEAPEAEAVEADEPEAEAPEAVAAPESDDKTELQPLSPPATWSAEDGAHFDALPREVQEVVLRREKEREAHFTKQSQEIAPIRQLFGQYNDYYSSIGADSLTAAQGLLAADRTLRSGTPQQKQAMLNALIQDYGLQAVLGQAAPNEDDDVFVDPQVSALRAELDQLKGDFSSRQAAVQQAEQARLQNDVAAFFNATTEAGELAHPYIEEVVDDMSALIQARQAQGMTPGAADLETFYEQACWANPGVRAKLIAQQQRDAQAREQAEQRRKVAKAKEASSSISGGASAVAARNGRKAPENESVRDTILRSIEEVSQASQ